MLNYKYSTSKKLSATPKSATVQKKVSPYRNVPSSYAHLMFESKKLSEPKRPEFLHDVFGNLTW